MLNEVRRLARAQSEQTTKIIAVRFRRERDGPERGVSVRDFKQPLTSAKREDEDEDEEGAHLVSRANGGDLSAGA